MGLRGPARTPTAINRLRGFPGKRGAPKHEPQPGAFHGEPPDFLGEVGRREWARLVPMLEAAGVLKETDYLALGPLFRAYENWVQCEDLIKKHGMLLKGRDGVVVKNPLLAPARHYFNELVKMLAQFAGTPSSRTSVHATEKPQASNPFLALG
jgi:P27 family predicted phage terminase small subunit